MANKPTRKKKDLVDQMRLDALRQKHLRQWKKVFISTKPKGKGLREEGMQQIQTLMQYPPRKTRKRKTRGKAVNPQRVITKYNQAVDPSGMRVRVPYYDNPDWFPEGIMTREGLVEAILETVSRRSRQQIIIQRYGPKSYDKLTPENQKAARKMAYGRWRDARDQQISANTRLGQSMSDTEDMLDMRKYNRQAAAGDDPLAAIGMGFMGGRDMTKKEWKASDRASRMYWKDVGAKDRRKEFKIVK